ncbi:hypothetical protein OHC33_005937 [Knufia fluminis]|uniref:BTB domain-containing protein n=1 Tax=Knufia fluminis TaxID=191047 RepID=A0AAN8EDF2_9EURO|nr:hypothetical protein OHC33_005937 [Knufia fluminis]
MSSAGESNATPDDHRPRKTHIRISPARPDQTYPKPRIIHMQEDQRQRLQFGYLVWLHVEQSADQDPIPLKLNNLDKFPIRSLCTMSPIINSAVRANGPEEVLDHITLPAGDIDAYLAILAWLDTITLTGKLEPIEMITEKPLSRYFHILDIAEKLRIEPITRNLGLRFERMITYVPGQRWNVQSEDVRCVYGECAVGHTLRVRLVENVARAWVSGGFGTKRREEIESLGWEIEEFWEELMEKVEEFEGREE